MDFISKKLTKKEIENLQKKHGDYLKLTADISKQVLVAGVELHADGEKFLLGQGSLQSDIWGGGIQLEEKEIDTTAVLNIRPGANNPSLEILSSDRRTKFIKVVEMAFEELWD